MLECMRVYMHVYVLVYVLCLCARVYA